MLIKDFDGNFSFLTLDELILKGNIKNDILTLQDISGEQDLNLEILLDSKDEILLKGWNTRQKITLAVISTMQKSRFNYTSNSFSSVYLFYLNYVLYGHVDHFDNNFKELIVNFSNINYLLTPNHIIYSSISKGGNRISFNVNELLKITFFVKFPLDPVDSVNANKIGLCTYVQFSFLKDLAFREKIALISTFTDLLNFLITEDKVIIHSFYWTPDIVKNSEYYKIKIRESQNMVSNKCTSTTPSLLQFELYELNFENIIKKWYEFRKYVSLYHTYFSHMYNKESPEHAVFKLSSFLESFHRDFVLGLSLKGNQRSNNRVTTIKSTFLDCFSEEEKEKIEDALKKGREPIYRLRILELIEPFVDIITIYNPILSILDHKSINEIPDMKFKNKSQIMDIITKKKHLDTVNEKIQNKDYHEIYDTIVKDEKLIDEFVEFTYKVTLCKFSQKITDFRNITAHIDMIEHEKIPHAHWVYMVLIMEMLCQVIILHWVIGLKSDEIKDTYKLSNLNKLKCILEIYLRPVSNFLIEWN